MKGDGSSMNRDSAHLILALIAGMILLPVSQFRAQEQQKPKQQKPPAQVLEQQQEEYTEEEYDAYEKSVNEPDLDKRPAMLLAFIDKYPKSKLMSYIVTAYQTLMYEYSKNQKYDKLEPLAEKWLKYHPDELQTIGYVAESAQKLGHDQKYLDYAMKIYAQKPTASLAYHIGQAYQKVGDQAKYLEWTERLFTYPEFAGDFGLRMMFVDKYAKEKNFAKAAEYAQLTLKALEVAKKPDTIPEGNWRRDVTSARRYSNFFIGMNYYEKKRWADAIKSLQAATKAEKFAEGYYYMGHCQWKLERIDEAMVAFAKAVMLKGEVASQAKKYLEEIYKGLHNNTTIGIDKIYNKAEKELAEISAEVIR